MGWVVGWAPELVAVETAAGVEAAAAVAVVTGAAEAKLNVKTMGIEPMLWLSYSLLCDSVHAYAMNRVS